MGRKKRRYTKENPPPDPHNYVFVNSKEGGYYRRKRGSVKEATLNIQFQGTADAMKIVAPVAKMIRYKLHSFLSDMDCGRFLGNFSGKIVKAYAETGTINYKYLKDYDIHIAHPLSNLVRAGYSIRQVNENIHLHIPIDTGTVKQFHDSATGYYFDAVLLHGNPLMENGIRVESEVSPLYTFESNVKDGCNFEFLLPENTYPWMVLLKCTCVEDRELLAGGRYRGMKVVAVG